MRRQRMCGAEIVCRLGMRRATVARILQREGPGRLRSLDPPEPPRRYVKQQPGELSKADVVSPDCHRMHQASVDRRQLADYLT